MNCDEVGEYMDVKLSDEAFAALVSITPADVEPDQYLGALIASGLKEVARRLPRQQDLDEVIAMWALMTPDQRATINRTVEEAKADQTAKETGAASPSPVPSTDSTAISDIP